jgi:hypothetical protein
MHSQNVAKAFKEKLFFQKLELLELEQYREDLIATQLEA